MLAAIQSFAADHGHVPHLSTLAAVVATDVDLIDRPDVIAMVPRALSRGNFLEALHASASQAHARQLTNVIRGAEGSWQRGDSVAAANQIVAGLAALADPAGVTSWPEPLPLDTTPTLPACPVHELPEVLAEFARAVGASTGTDPSMAFTSILGALAACGQRGHSWVVAGDWREAAPLFLVAVMDPAERKSVLEYVYLWQVEQSQKTAEKAREHLLACRSSAPMRRLRRGHAGPSSRLRSPRSRLRSPSLRRCSRPRARRSG